MLLTVVFWWALLVPPALLVCFLWWRSGRRWVGLAATWAPILGFVGFVIGFVGPLVWSPESNQGPLLGIFLTGPLAFAVTATTLLIVGAVKWKSQRHLAAGIAPHAP